MGNALWHAHIIFSLNHKSAKIPQLHSIAMATYFEYKSFFYLPTNITPAVKLLVERE